MVKRIGILTSGGDCAGLNAVIRGVVGRAVDGLGWQVIGIRDGTAGLLCKPPEVVNLEISMFTGQIMRQGGTILGTTNRGDPFAFPMPDGSEKDRSQEIIAAYHTIGLDALIGIGGDGSMAILRRLATQGDMSLVGIPKTIDNEIGSTEFSVGYATAVDVATQALDMLQPTAASHSRVMILEVMGRDAGHIAMAAGLAGGADVILIPEIPYKIANIAAKIDRLKSAAVTLPWPLSPKRSSARMARRHGWSTVMAKPVMVASAPIWPMPSMRRPRPRPASPSSATSSAARPPVLRIDCLAKPSALPLST